MHFSEIIKLFFWKKWTIFCKLKPDDSINVFITKTWLQSHFWARQPSSVVSKKRPLLIFSGPQSLIPTSMDLKLTFYIIKKWGSPRDFVGWCFAILSLPSQIDKDICTCLGNVLWDINNGDEHTKKKVLHFLSGYFPDFLGRLNLFFGKWLLRDQGNVARILGVRDSLLSRTALPTVPIFVRVTWSKRCSPLRVRWKFVRLRLVCLFVCLLACFIAFDVDLEIIDAQKICKSCFFFALFSFFFFFRLLYL